MGVTTFQTGGMFVVSSLSRWESVPAVKREPDRAKPQERAGEAPNPALRATFSRWEKDSIRTCPKTSAKNKKVRLCGETPLKQGRTAAAPPRSVPGSVRAFRARNGSSLQATSVAHMDR